ncbi:MAG TPA: glutamine amidotransferase [Ruminococcaceae bacterium]|nr:glutamine amidotransferase [Oscillospiraceae bacterium]
MKLLHLYHDIMNLYGDYANVSALCRALEKNGEAVELDRLSLGDTADLTLYDFIFIGSGTEKNQKLVLADFQKYSDSLSAYIESGKCALLTGNSFEMLGKSITDCNGNAYEGMGFCPFDVTEQSKTRLTADVIYEADFLKTPLVGFVNKCSEIKGNTKPLFSVKMGLSDCEGSKGEGIRLNNLFGTHLTGPALMKNPHFLEYIASLILGRQPESDYLNYERAGYEITLRELTKRMNEN